MRAHRSTPGCGVTADTPYFYEVYYFLLKERTLLKPVEKNSEIYSLLKWVAPFFPSWRFFEVFGEEPSLWLRVDRSEDELSRAEWFEAFELKESMRGWGKIWMNPESNDRYWKLSAVERWTNEPDSRIESARVIRLAEAEASLWADSRLSRSQADEPFWFEGEVRQRDQVLIQLRARPLLRETDESLMTRRPV